MGGYRSLPIGGGWVRGPARVPAHSAQSCHQDSLCRVAVSRHCPAEAGLGGPAAAGPAGSAALLGGPAALLGGPAASYHAFGPGGFTIPAMCPPLEST